MPMDEAVIFKIRPAEADHEGAIDMAKPEVQRLSASIRKTAERRMHSTAGTLPLLLVLAACASSPPPLPEPKADTAPPAFTVVEPIHISRDPSVPDINVAVVDFQVGVQEAEPVLGIGLASQLTSALTRVENFKVLDRQMTSEIASELKLSTTSLVQKSDKINSVAHQVADLLLVGTVTEFSDSVEGSRKEKGFNTDAIAGIAQLGQGSVAAAGSALAIAAPNYQTASEKTTGLVRLNVRAVDVRTRVIVADVEATGTFTTVKQSRQFGAMGADFNDSQFARSSLGQATKLAVNDAVKQLYDRCSMWGKNEGIGQIAGAQKTAGSPLRPATAGSGSNPAPNAMPTFDIGAFALAAQSDGARRIVPIRDGSVLRSGDMFQVYVTASQTSHCYLVSLDSQGKLSVIFPADNVNLANPLPANQKAVIPPGDDWFYLDDHTGTESLFFILSRDPLPQLDRMLREALPENRQAEFKEYVAQTEVRTRGIGGVRHELGSAQRISAKDPEGARVQAEVLGTVLRSPGTIVHQLTFKHE